MASLFRQVNLKMTGKMDLSPMKFEGFLELFVQTAFYLAIKIDKNSLHLPAECLKTFFFRFTEAAASRGDIEIHNKDDEEEIENKKMLAKYIKENPTGPLPNGYKKVEEKLPIENYSIPCYCQISESHKIVIELLDELLAKNIGVHVLEPIVTYDYDTKVVSTQANSPNKSPTKHFMLPLIKVPRKLNIKPVFNTRSQNMKQSLNPLSLHLGRDNNSELRDDDDMSQFGKTPSIDNRSNSLYKKPTLGSFMKDASFKNDNKVKRLMESSLKRKNDKELREKEEIEKKLFILKINLF